MQTLAEKLAEKHAKLPAVVAGWAVASGKAQAKDYDDLVGYLSVGLCEACQRFDPARGAEASTYLTACLRKSVNTFYNRVIDTRAISVGDSCGQLDEPDTGELHPSNNKLMLLVQCAELEELEERSLMFMLDGETLKQTAKELKTSVTTVRRLRKQGQGQLKTWLRKHKFCWEDFLE